MRRPLPTTTACGCIAPVGPTGAVVGRLDGHPVYPALAASVGPRAGRDTHVLTGRR